jgi:2-oxoglutarate dehydrogenase E2 component (dihydrolipoamide succinyltransferase)
MSAVPVKVPALGESVSEATVASWRRAVGDVVKADEPLVEIESEKATVEIPSPGSGVLRRILRQQGDTVAIGEVIAEIETAPGASEVVAPDGGARPAESPTPAVTSPAVGAAAAAPALAEPSGPALHSGNGAAADVKASPALRRLMAENELGPADVKATGPAGRLEREDVLRALESRTEPRAAPAAPPPASAPPVTPLPPPRPVTGKPQRVVPMSPLRKTVARRLLDAQQNAAILTTFNEINMAEVMAVRERYQEAFQKRHGIKLGFMSFFVKAATDALKTYPIVNAEVRGTDIVYKDYFDIGIAVGGGRGLVVPVVRNADRLSLAEVERTIAELAGRAKENKLRPEELEGGTFTISNGGIYGSMLSTPILNPPQSGILGLHAIQKRAVAVGEAIALRPMMYVALSYDHRIIDGREAVQFLVRIKECVEDPQRLLVEV